ncbi:unnamed protein product [Mytilus edulis]|uniref:Uncharacterized protein n=1 Tax=Mytilus edulis TaxID=6550 RepID=A0A8S3R410_MYTED|nr:unnamed protein product [Mytilus edulis]
MRARACLVQVDDQFHDEAKTAAKKRDEKHVQDLSVSKYYFHGITENMTNPCDADNHPPNIIPAVHALTGCDTTSAIFGFGKKTVFKLIRKSPSKFTNLQNFDKIDFSTSLSAARELISSLYDPEDKFASSHVDLNKLRVKLATCKDTSLLRLPPSEPAFNEHVLRSFLQTKIWMSSHLDHPNPLSPYEYGWSSHGQDPVYFLGMMRRPISCKI